MSRSKILRTIGALSLALLLTDPAAAEVTFEFIGTGIATDISADGSVVVGYGDGSQNFEAFRWTRETGQELLGQNAYLVFGTGAGTPAVSADGTQVSATILSLDGTAITQGRWTLGLGWQETMPPIPSDGGIMDNALGSCWGISGDGSTVVGLYWRPGQGDGSAHASAWTEDGGLVGQESSDNSRANNANHDGSVVVGWHDGVEFGAWQPAVWENGVLTRLNETAAGGQAEAVTPDGNIIVGREWNDATQTNEPVMWRRTESGWTESLYLGTLPGVIPSAGFMKAEGIDASGDLVVGYCTYAGDPFYTTGFLWTPEFGVVDVVDYLADNGVAAPANFDIRSLQSVSDDGLVMLGTGYDTVAPFASRSFIIRNETATGVGDGEPDVRPTRVSFAAWPNPIRSGGTTFMLDLPRDVRGTVKVFDVAGRLVRELSDGTLSAGQNRLSWDGRDGGGQAVASGLYCAHFVGEEFRQTRKVVIQR